MSDIDPIGVEIERLRVQVRRERREILELHKARHDALAAQAPLARIDAVCAGDERRIRVRDEGHYSLR